MNWEDIKFHLVTILYLSLTSLLFGLLGFFASRVLLP
jgi:hypothetical protein